ncbi:CYTH domain-containing protein [Mucilaginibacter sp.]|uniref:CYTH domain-containing protein n=1 Tax=Mucilaginibacter sp. TaxID=1882438 RepID=UPI00262B2A59|nr:CYTH domain-containing protein [Mucilaginibacter sp.]MDB5032739.1 hypothetical protein [Mucilaginibacter sp.]
MGIEIERKFLVDAIQWQQLSKPVGSNFKQGYIVNDAAKTIRVRITDQYACLTFKGETLGFTRSEYEYTIPVEDGIEMLEKFAGPIIQKTRYCINFESKLWEVDVFSGDNEGLIVAEIELKQETEQFKLPPWVTQEVTGQEKYYNSNLSTHPFKKW